MPSSAGQETRCLAELPERLRAAGYQASALRPLLHRGILDVTPDLLPALSRRCRDAGTPAARLAAFWLLREPLSEAELAKLLGRDLVDALHRSGRIQVEGAEARALCGLYPLLGACFFADPVLHFAGETPSGGRPWLDLAGYALALAVPHSVGDDALDLHPGGGVQTVLSAESHGRSWGLAGEGSREDCLANARMNGREAVCRFVAAPEEASGSFHRITARLPILLPAEDFPLVQGWADLLARGGTLALAIRHFTPDRPLLERVQAWLGGATGWGLGQLTYAGSTLKGPGDDPKATLEEQGRDQVGLAAGFEGAAESLVFVRRLAPDRPGWRASVNLSPPQESLSDMTADWLEAQERFSSPGWQSGWAAWRPEWSFADRLFVDPKSRLGMVRYRKGFELTAVDPESADVLRTVDGQRSAGEVLAQVAEDWGKSVEQARPEAARCLSELARRVMIR